MKKWLMVGAGLALLGLGLLGIPGVILTTFILPEHYASVARVVLEESPATPPAPRKAWEPDWLATEAQIICSKRVLFNVASNLNLGHQWAQEFREENDLSPEIVYALLKTRVEVRQSRNTAILEIRVMGEDRNEAANIANEIAKVYRAQRSAQIGDQGQTACRSVSIIDQAEPAFRPAQSKLRVMAPGLGVCAFLIVSGAVLLFLASRFSRPTGANP